MFELPKFQERAQALINSGALAISKSKELQAELVELCNSINRPLNGQFKNGCKNCINDGLTFLNIALKNENKMKINTSDKYLKPAGKVQLGGNIFNFEKLSDNDIEMYLKRFPQLSAIVKPNPNFGKKTQLKSEEEKKKAELEAQAKAEEEAKLKAEEEKTNKK